MKSILDYFAGIRAEMSHVKWPSVPQAIGYTAFVVLISLLVAALLGALDYVFVFITEWIVR